MTSQSNGVQRIYAIHLNQDGRSELLELEPTATIGYRGNTAGLGLDSTTVTLAQLPTIPDAAAVADFDQDGDTDFVVSDAFGELRYFRNDWAPPLRGVPQSADERAAR